jgi:uncharacterized protein YbjT (DUF2867 family)
MGTSDPGTDGRTVAFVAGATGYVGQQVVRQLVAAGFRTVAHVRPDSARLSEWWTRFTEMGADPDATPWTVPAMSATLKDLQPRVVFCLVGTTRRRMQSLSRAGRSPDTASYEAVDYGLTALLAQAAAHAGHAPRFVYLSAMGAGPNPKGAYMRWRTKAEHAVLGSGLPYTIVRPAMITGPDREENRRGERIANSVLDGALGLARSLGFQGPWQRYRSIDAAGLAAVMIRLAMEPQAANHTIEREELVAGAPGR